MTYSERLICIGEWKEELCRCCMRRADCRDTDSCHLAEMSYLHRLYDICLFKSEVEKNEKQAEVDA